MFKQIRTRIRNLNPWHFLWIAVLFSEILTFISSTLASLILWGRIPDNVLLIGVIDAFVAPFIVSPFIIYFFIRQTARLTKANELLHKEIAERALLEEKFRVLSLTDELTGLHNRRGFFALAEEQLKIAKRRRTSIFLLYADVDNLKEINDAFGHKEGNSALIEIAGILKSCYRESDIIARIGGDEFAIISIETSGEDIYKIIDRLQKSIEMRNKQSDCNYELSISFGMACYDPGNPSSIDDLLSHADKLMYEKKRQKKLS